MGKPPARLVPDAPRHLPIVVASFPTALVGRKRSEPSSLNACHATLGIAQSIRPLLMSPRRRCDARPNRRRCHRRCRSASVRSLAWRPSVESRLFQAHSSLPATPRTRQNGWNRSAQRDRTGVWRRPRSVLRWSTQCATVRAVRRSPQEGKNPHRSHMYATSLS